jgi:hypothetical protein
MTTIKTSRFVGPIKNQVEDWDRRLVLFSKTLEEWILCQKRWLYLKQIFSTPDIQRQLIQETKVFNQVTTCFLNKIKFSALLRVFKFLRLRNSGKNS